MQEILVICAHSDDQIIGPGGTLAKYAEEGHSIRTLIMSFGELSHPHVKKDLIADIRIKESLRADEVIGGKNVTFLGIPEGKFLEEKNIQIAIEAIQKAILKYKPKKIFTHTPDDPIADHRGVFRIVLRAYDEIKPKSEVYCFDIWNPIIINARSHPKLVVDISKYFSKKRKALLEFQSQKVTFFSMIWAIYFRAIYQGLKNRKKFAEVFYRVR